MSMQQERTPVTPPATQPQVPTTDRELAALFRGALESDSPELRGLTRRARWTSARMLVGIGDERMLVEVREGVLMLHAEIPLLCSWDFSVRGPAHAWASLWRAVPEPGRHDLFALTKRGELQVEGNLQPFMSSLQYFKDLLTMPRGSL